MLDLITKDDLRELMEERDGPCVSIYMPTHTAGAEIEQDPIRLKNLIREAEERLRAAGLRSPQARQILEPAEDLVLDGLFWQHQSDGLALFLAPGYWRHNRLPLDFQEFLSISDRFHIKPILPVLAGDGRFYVLAISQKQVRLLQGTRFSVSELNLEGVPNSLAEALRFDDPEAQLQFYTNLPRLGGQGEHTAAFHGHGVGTDDAKTNILRFFHKVDDGLSEFLREDRAPLVLACVEYLAPIFREASSYAQLAGKSVSGNPDDLSAGELHRRAWEIVGPAFEAERQEAIQRFGEASGEGLTSTDLKEIVAGAHYGRIDTLFVTLGRQQWGRFDPETNVLHVHPAMQPGDVDLYDLAAAQTVLNGGKVYAFEEGEGPGGEPMAAILRY